jgi:MFS family permease
MSDDSNELSSPPAGRIAAFHYRDFRLYWTGLFLSNIGTWMQITAVSWLIYRMTRSPLQLGMNGLFRAVPAICLGVISGTIADRYDRRKLMLATQCLLGMLALLLGVLDHSENIQLWQIYGITFASAAVASADGPARQALFPALVPESVLPNAVALNSILMKGPALIGPLLAGIVISLIGTHGHFTQMPGVIFALSSRCY